MEFNQIQDKTFSQSFTSFCKQLLELKVSGPDSRMMARKMKRNFLLLVFLIIVCFIFYWIIWLNIADSEDEATKKGNLITDIDSWFDPNTNHHRKPGMVVEAPTNISKFMQQEPIKLPTNLNSVNLESLGPLRFSPDLSNEKEDEDLQGPGDGVSSGLSFFNRMFYLNRKKFVVLSGSIHYFRIIPEYWSDRLKKLKACGFNTVETYVPWNLHEPGPGVYDFEGMLNLRKFLWLANELGLYVILRPGPYICSEYDFGGLPGWLLADKTMRVRTNHAGYINSVNKYFSVLFPQLMDLQFSEGGPIIMFQVENEYASFAADPNHVRLLYYMFRMYGVKELIVTSDGLFTSKLYKKKPQYDISNYAMPTWNGRMLKKDNLELMYSLNEQAPIMFMEFWCGWFDYWGKAAHETKDSSLFNDTVSEILKMGGSINLYMFHGGTNFGFTSGAINLTEYQPFVTSYDYDAPLTEAGDTTPKYYVLRNILLKFYLAMGFTQLPPVPPGIPKANYGTFQVSEVLEWRSLLRLIPTLTQDNQLNYMEGYKDEDGRHHTMGYIIYSHKLKPGTVVKRLSGLQMLPYVSGRLTAMLDGQTFFVGSDFAPISKEDFLWEKRAKESSMENLYQYETDYGDAVREPRWLLPFYIKVKAMTQRMEQAEDKDQEREMDLMVENQGRVGYVKQDSQEFDRQRRGLKGSVLKTVFGVNEELWSVRSLHFDRKQSQSISKSKDWRSLRAHITQLEKDGDKSRRRPMMYRLYLNIEGSPKDTFVKLVGWNKGVVIVNNFNLGRYWHIGPQQTLYLPAPLLHTGNNEILIFEEVASGTDVVFQENPDLG